MTLQENLRKKFGIQKDGTVVIEDRNGEIVLKPAIVLEVEMYSDEQIDEWDREDQLGAAERARMIEKLGR